MLVALERDPLRSLGDRRKVLLSRRWRREREDGLSAALLPSARCVHRARFGGGGVVLHYSTYSTVVNLNPHYSTYLYSVVVY